MAGEKKGGGGRMVPELLPPEGEAVAGRFSEEPGASDRVRSASGRARSRADWPSLVRSAMLSDGLDVAELEGLTLQQQLFVLEYTGECWGNATQAARCAGYRDGSSISGTASDLLGKESIQAAIRAVLRVAGVSSSELMASLVSQMRGTLEDFYKLSGDGEEVVSDLAGAYRRGRFRNLKRMKVKRTIKPDMERGGVLIDEEIDLELRDPGAARKQLLDVLRMTGRDRRELSLQDTNQRAEVRVDLGRLSRAALLEIHAATGAGGVVDMDALSSDALLEYLEATGGLGGE